MTEVFDKELFAPSGTFYVLGILDYLSDLGHGMIT